MYRSILWTSGIMSLEISTRKSKKIRVCCSTYWYPEYKNDIHAIYVHDINRFLAKNGCDIYVVTPNFSKSKIKETYDNISIFRFNFHIPIELSYGKVAQGKSRKTLFSKWKSLYYMFLYTLYNFFYTYKTAKKKKVDILHAHWSIPSGFSTLIVGKLLKIPCVITMHGGDVYYNPKQGYIFPKIWYIRPILKQILKNADLLTAISEDCKSHAIRAGAPQEKIAIINNGTDTERFKPFINEEVRKIQKKYDIKKESIFICRQLIPRKGVRFAIEAMPLILNKFPETKLLIAGDGIERPKLEDIINKLRLQNNVFLLGWIPNKDLPKFYNACSISVIPSLEEGFGIPAVESMACETPVVASDAGGLPEIVINEYTGLIVPKGDVETLANAIIRLFESPELTERLGKNGREFVLKNFSWDKTAKEFITRYEGMLYKN